MKDLTLSNYSEILVQRSVYMKDLTLSDYSGILI